jgi:hypothetical protein
MVPVLSLWLPILLSAVTVFVLSSIIHMMLGYHANDYRSLSDEAGVMDALRPFNIPPGNYAFPKPKDMKDMGSPEFKAKYARGPVAFVTVLPGGPISMTREMVLWFLYSIVVGIFAAYIAGRALEPGANYLEVFRFAGATAFIGYGLAQWQQSIWYKLNWTTTLKNNIDALIYALFTGGVFGWLWP